MTSPPEAPLSGWFLLALLVGGVLYLVVRAARNDRGWGAGLGVGIGSFFALLLPNAAVGLTQDLTCRDGGVLDRPNGAVIVMAVTALSLVWLLTMFWVAGNRMPGSGRRLAVIPVALLVPVALVELMGPPLPLEDYCDGVRGVLLLQSALGLLVPVAAIVLASISGGVPSEFSRLSPAVVFAGAAVVLTAQAVVLVDRLRPDPLACVTRATLPPIDGIRGPDTGVAVADFDGDGTVDIGVFDRSRSAHVLANDGRGAFTDTVVASAPVGYSPHGDVAAGDVDGNGHVDLVVAGTEVEQGRDRRRRAGVAVLLNDGKTFKPTPPLYFESENPYMAVELGDLDGDGNAEVVVSEGGAVVVLWDRAGQLEVGPRLLPPAPADAAKLSQRDFALVDVDGDDRLDVVSWGGGLRSPSYLVVYRNAGARKFTSAIAATVENEYLSGAAVADFDGDGDIDVVENGGTDRLVVLVNQGDGRFDVTSRTRRVGADKLFPADVDGDGRTDLVLSIGFVSDVVNEPGFLFVRLNRGGFKFSDAQRLAIPRTLLAIAELNGDGRADYVVDEFRTMDVLLSRGC